MRRYADELIVKLVAHPASSWWKQLPAAAECERSGGLRRRYSAAIATTRARPAEPYFIDPHPALWHVALQER